MPGRARRRQRRRRGAGRRRRRRRPRARAGERPDADRGRDLPLVRPLRRRQSRLPRRGGGRDWRAPRPADPGACRRSIPHDGRRRSTRRSRTEIAAALEFALASPIAGPEALTLDHYASSRMSSHRDRTETRSLKFWQGINQALVEEMERDERVVLSARTSAGPAAPTASPAACSTRFGACAGPRHADQRGGARRPRRRRRARSGCARSSRSCSSTSRCWRWTRSSTRPRSTGTSPAHSHAADDPHDVRRRRAERRPALAELRGVVLRRPRAEGRDAVERRRRQGPAEVRDPRRRPDALHRDARAC